MGAHEPSPQAKEPFASNFSWRTVSSLRVVTPARLTMLSSRWPHSHAALESVGYKRRGGHVVERENMGMHPDEVGER